jgi:LEA14-like dessication related protein
MKSTIVICFIVIFLGSIISCKSVKSAETPQQEIQSEHERLLPELMLTFENIEAENPETLYLNFQLDLCNITMSNAELLLQTPTLMINGNLADENLFSLELPTISTLMQMENKTIPLRLTFYASEYEKIYQSDFDEYELTLSIPVHFIFSEKTETTSANAKAIFPRVRKPNFNISSIQIVQAELINTRLKVSLQIDNPNYFPVDLTSFNYELFGDGRFWAKGEEKDILKIPAKDSASIDLFLTMNFTNMRRNVLDQVIAMTEVRYRFEGSAAVETGVTYLPRFVMNFEQEGHSKVMR